MLELEGVCKGFRRGAEHVNVLREVCLQVHEREVVAVWGARGSGRSTLLRITAGIDAPDSGSVRFQGRELTRGGGAIGRGIAYCQPAPRSTGAWVAIEELIATQLALGIGRSAARTRAWQTLERAGARHCEGRRPYELNRAESVRMALANALLQEPSLLIVDDPTTGVEPIERDRILELLRSLAQDGLAILMSLDKGIGLFAADRALSLGEGRLRGHATTELAPVVQLPLRMSG